MAIGKVNVALVNANQGAFKEVERTFLYFGTGANAANNGKVLAISAQSDLDDLLGATVSNLKTQIEAAIENSQDDGFFCYAVPLAAEADWTELLDAVLEKPNDLNIEAVAVCDPALALADITAAQTAMANALSKYAKYITCHMAIEGIKVTETWTEYKTRIKALITSVTAARVSVVPQLHGNDLGVVCGRLCNPAVTLADSPMRVATGAVSGLGAAPVDKDSKPLTMADITELALARFSVPQWYAGYTGIYWADHSMLDAEAGDFQVYENIRVLDYLARRVRLLAIAKVADRGLNNTDKSVETNKTYFMRPLRDASKAITIAGTEFPGMIQAPADGDIDITWNSNTDVAISISAQPYSCPKKITVYLALDLGVTA